MAYLSNPRLHLLRLIDQPQEILFFFVCPEAAREYADTIRDTLAHEALDRRNVLCLIFVGFVGVLRFSQTLLYQDFLC